MTLAEFKALIREQFLLLLIDPEAALGAIPDMLPSDMDDRRKGLGALHEVLSARGELSGEAAEWWQRIAGLFGVEDKPPATSESNETSRAGLAKAS